MKGLRFIRLVAAVLVGCVTVLAAALVVLLAVDLSAYRGVLESRLSTVLDRHVVLGGEIRISLDPRPTVTATQVAIVNPDWAHEPHLAAAKRLSVGVRLWPLLRGDLQVARVQLTGAEVRLETRADGSGNWLPNRPDSPDDSDATRVRTLLARLPRLEVRDSRVAFRDGRSGVVTAMEIAWASVAAPRGESLRISFQGTLRGHPVAAEFEGGSLLALVERDAPWPVELTLEDGSNRVNARGNLQRRPFPRFELDITAEGARFAALGPLVGAPLPALGPFRVEGRLTRDQAGYALREVRGHVGGQNALLRVTLADGTVDAPFSEPMRLEARGTYQEEPFLLEIDAAPYAQLLDGRDPWRAEARLHLRHSRLNLAGALEPVTRDFRVHVDAEGEDLASLAPVAGRPLPHLGPYLLQARVERTGTTWRLEEIRLRAGRSNLEGLLTVDTAGDRPYLGGALEADSLDLGQVRDVLAVIREEQPPAPPDAPLADRAAPMDALRLVDGDLELRAARVEGAGPLLEALRARLRLTEGTLQADVGNVRIAGEDLSGRIALRPTNGPPHGELDVQAREVAYGPVLAALGLTDRVQGNAQGLEFTLRGSGRTLRELWAGSTLTLAVEHATLAIVTPDGAAPSLVRLDSGELSVGQRAALKLRAAGHYHGRPFDVNATAGGLRDLLDEMQPWPVSLQGGYGTSRLSAEGSILDPVRARGADLKLHAQGPRLNELGRLLGVALPALGPYRLAGELRDAAQGVVFTQIDAGIGESDLSGELAVAPTDAGLRIRAQLRSRTLRTADLHPRTDTPAPPDAGNADTTGSDASPAAGLLRAIPDIAYPVDSLRRVQMEMAYTAQRLVLGGVEIEAVSARGGLHGGKLELKPVQGMLWGGTVTGTLTVDASTRPVRTRVTLAGERVEYTRATAAPGKAGVTRGTISLVSHLEGTGDDLRSAAATADGVVEFLGGQGQIDNRLLDLWGADLFLAALPKLGDRAATPVRCLLGRFSVASGVAETKSLLADLDRLVVKGVGSIDLRDETLDLLLWPEPRDRSLLRVTTPIRITGTLRKPDIGPQPRGVLEEVTWLLVGANNPFVLLFGLIHPGTPDQDPCKAAAEQGAKRPDITAEYSPPTPFTKAWDFLKGVGRMITSPFEDDESGGKQPDAPAEP